MFRFIHCSDWHLPYPPPSREHLPLKPWLSSLSWRLKRHRRHRQEVFDAARRFWLESEVDRFCITGDLVNFAQPEEYRRAATELEQLGQVAPISLVTGNHDALVASGLDEARTHWAPWLGRDPPGTEGIPVIRHGPVAVVDLSSGIATAPFMAYGAMASAQLTALANVLPKLQRSGHFRVVMVHHPPQAGAAGWRRGLHHAAALRDILHRTGAELVLHGHLHHPVRAWLPGPDKPIPVFGAGSSSYFSPRADGLQGHFHQFSINGRPGDWHLEVSDCIHDPRDGGFHPSPFEAVPRI